MIELHRLATRARTPKDCTLCHARISPRETYYRWEISADGKPQRFPVQMIECAACAGPQDSASPSSAFEPSPRPMRVTAENRGELVGEPLRYITLPRTSVTHLAEVRMGDGAWLAVRPICRTVRDREWSFRDLGGNLELYRWINTYNGEAPSAVSAVPGEDLRGKGWDLSSACPRCLSAYRRLYAEWRRAQAVEAQGIEDLL